jgi:c(7)-type cytochrome triheme protein
VKRHDFKMMKAAVFPLVLSLAVLLPGIGVEAADPNVFNRLMKPPSMRNPPPAKDGIHDPPAATLLQPPKDSFGQLPKGTSGNYVDWVKALEAGDIQPRFDRVDPDAKPVIMDLNIVREVKGSMPNVVYPHKQHTEWLDCSNCHPAIFVPQKGGNDISMAAILLGEKCGVCHGKVAFPVSECRRCHSQSKSQAKAGQATAAGAAQSKAAQPRQAPAKP